MSARRKTPSERRYKRASGQRLTREEVIHQAVKILGEGRTQRSVVEKVVEYTNKLCDGWKRTRLQESGNQKRFAKQYGAARRKVFAMVKKTEHNFDFRPLPRFQVIVPELGIDKEVFDHEHFVRHLQLLIVICERWEKSKLDAPTPSAEDKRLAAWAALYLCETQGIEPVTTKTGELCRLAAVLYGDSGADLQHHCRSVLKERRAGSKAFMRARFVGGHLEWGNQSI